MAWPSFELSIAREKWGVELRKRQQTPSKSLNEHTRMGYFRSYISSYPVNHREPHLKNKKTTQDQYERLSEELPRQSGRKSGEAEKLGIPLRFLFRSSPKADLRSEISSSNPEEMVLGNAGISRKSEDRSRRSMVACNRCRSRKTRCAGNPPHPCAACVDVGKACVYSEAEKRVSITER